MPPSCAPTWLSRPLEPGPGRESSCSGFDASAPNYGPLPNDAEEVLRGACPVVASYGRRDVGLRGTAARLESTLTRLGVDHDVKEYPDAGHSFLRGSRGQASRRSSRPRISP